ncbi:glycosylated lysosomal membrane protein [Thalassophryne amazonica]|uniref:glycosylated lysosomal membrane protein n=1 Tax=Thalassophryne amazonica TaxID=390379 RepID=UPI0014709AB0|nr:glycosylated lysosomal membrane protein [Thalassophryne amazonica]
MAVAIRLWVSLNVLRFIFLLLFCLCDRLKSESFRRTLSVTLNPGLNSSVAPPGGDLLHIRALGDNDTLHFLFCSQGAPTLLLIHTNTPTSILKVNWTEFLSPNSSNSLKVTPESSVVSSNAIIYSRLWEYDDVTANSTSGLFPPYELQSFIWSHLDLFGTSARLCGTAPTFSNGTLCLQLSAFESEGRDEDYPRLLHSSNSSQLKVWLNGVPPRSPSSQFSLELQAVGGAFPLSRVEVLRSIDDEFTPSIFQVSQWVPPENSSLDGFVQWKPVAYRQPHAELEDATPCRHTAPQHMNGTTAPTASRLIQAFYGTEIESFGINISFGIAGEPLYNATRFLSWTLLMGVGSPPVDSFSPLVVTIMAVGLGTPMILLLLGGVYVCVRKSQLPTYEPIN